MGESNSSNITSHMKRPIYPTQRLGRILLFRHFLGPRHNPSDRLSSHIAKKHIENLELRGVPNPRKQARKDIDTALKMVERYTAGKDKESPEMRRMNQILSSNGHFNTFEIALEVVDEQHREEERRSSIPPPAQPQIDLPLPPAAFVKSDDLEVLLPAGPEPRHILISAVARILDHHARACTPIIDVEALYRKPVIELRSNPSVQKTLDFARKLADVSLGLDPIPRDLYPEMPKQMPSSEYEREIAGLKQHLAGFAKAHFKDIVPDKTTLTNLEILFGYAEKEIAPKLAKGKFGNSEHYTIRGCYDADGKIIPSDTVLENTTEFLLVLDLKSGKLKVSSGLEKHQIAMLDGAQLIQPKGEAPFIFYYTEATPSIAEVAEGLDADVYKSLRSPERELVAAALEDSCTEDNLHAFVNMHPGLRELRMKNFISSRWTQPDFKSSQEKYHNAMNSLYQKCALAKPTAKEKREALLDPKSPQAEIMASFFAVTPNKLTPHLVKEFGQWLTDRQNHNYWKGHSTNLITLAEFVQNARFGSRHEINETERHVLSQIYGTEEISADHVTAFRDALIWKTEKDSSENYRDEILRLSDFRQFLDANALRKAARRYHEFQTLLDFAGVPVQDVCASITYDKGITKAKFKHPTAAQPEYSKTNDDCFSSATVKLPDGKILHIDAVFDGMGGYDKGHIASRIAREIFEISALAGWIQTPGDARRVIIMADIAITAAQLASKQNKDSKKESKMGTTAAITMRRGPEFYGIHVGDSPYKVIRKGKIVFQSRDHSLGNETQDLARKKGQPFDPSTVAHLGNIIVSGLGSELRYLHINNTNSTTSPFILRNGDKILVVSDGSSDVTTDEEYGIIMDASTSASLELVKNALKDACEGIVLSDSGYGLNAAAQLLIDIAEHRRKDEKYATLFPPEEIEGKNDDKTVLLDQAEISRLEWFACAAKQLFKGLWRRSQ